MPSQTDSELAVGIRDGDEGAFRELFYRYHEPLFRFAHRRLGDSALASDIVQEVFARVWEQRKGIDPALSVRAFLYRSAGNLVIDHYRRQAVRQKYESEIEVAPTQPIAEYLFLEADVKEAVASMPELQRQAFVLSRYDGLTYAEIAKVLDISVKAVEKRMSVALKHLRASLAHFLGLAWLAVATILKGLVG